MPQPTISRSAADVRGERQLLTFTIDAEEYAVDVLRVQEIRAYSGITPIPNSPPHIKGVMNLRGTVAPVVGLREKFHFSPRAYDKFTVIIVLTFGTKVIGMVVDTVSDVISVGTADVEPPPDMGSSVDTSFIVGMARANERLVIMLDVDRVLQDAASAESAPS